MRSRRDSMAPKKSIRTRRWNRCFTTYLIPNGSAIGAVWKMTISATAERTLPTTSLSRKWKKPAGFSVPSSDWLPHFPPATRRPGANAVSGGRCVPGTIVCSVYGKPESYFLHKMQQMPQRVLYQDIEKGRELDARAKLQLFGGNIASPDLDRKIIRLPECIVKLQAGSAPTEAARVQQESRDMASGSHALGAARPAFGTPAMNRPIDSNLE